MTAPATRGRLDHVDAMRAIAVILVMWSHYADLYVQISGSQHVLEAIQASVNFGRVGVVLFFGISGLLIPNSLRGTPVDGTKRFLIRRFFRLYPAFWLSMPIGYVAYWMIFGHQMNFTDVIANITMIPTAFGHEPVMAHYWTLETELYFYALCLALFLLGALHRMRDLCLTVIGLCALFVVVSALKLIPADALGQYKGMLYHLAIMFWGACFRQAYDSPHALVMPDARAKLRWLSTLSFRTAFIYVTALIVAIALLMGVIDLRHHDYVHVSVSIGYIVGLALFVLFATVLKIHAKLFAWIGEISYSIYLLHGVPMYVIYWYCTTHGLTGGPLGVYMLVTVPPALLLSWASFRLVEAAGIRIGHALTSSKGPRPAVATQAAKSTQPTVKSADTARPAWAARDDS